MTWTLEATRVTRKSCATGSFRFCGSVAIGAAAAAQYCEQLRMKKNQHTRIATHAKWTQESQLIEAHLVGRRSLFSRLPAFGCLHLRRIPCKTMRCALVKLRKIFSGFQGQHAHSTLTLSEENAGNCGPNLIVYLDKRNVTKTKQQSKQQKEGAGTGSCRGWTGSWRGWSGWAGSWRGWSGWSGWAGSWPLAIYVAARRGLSCHAAILFCSIEVAAE